MRWWGVLRACSKHDERSAPQGERVLSALEAFSALAIPATITPAIRGGFPCLIILL